MNITNAKSSQRPTFRRKREIFADENVQSLSIDYTRIPSTRSKYTSTFDRGKVFCRPSLHNHDTALRKRGSDSSDFSLISSISSHSGNLVVGEVINGLCSVKLVLLPK